MTPETPIEYVLWALPFGLLGIISWSFWGVRKFLSTITRPVVNDFRTTTTVVVPSYHEDPDVLLRCLATWIRQRPTRIIIVLDVADLEAQERIEALRDPSVEVVMFKHHGKRSALGVGIRMVDTELIIFVDSDTAWEEGMLEAVQMPFIDPAVGAVSTRQNVYRPRSSIWRRVADWIIDLRYSDYAPAMGRYGGIICASGRTAAYRRSVIQPQVEDLEHEIFFGRECVAGDDGRMTWLVLSKGFRVTHQDSARALSMFPDTFRAFVKQRVRWNRNSYRCYLTAIGRGWVFKAPFISQLTMMQIMLTPFTMFVAVLYVFLALRSAHPILSLSLAILWLLVGRGIRGISHLWRRPEDIVLLPLVAVVIILVALPIKVYSLFTMNKQGWLTRSATQQGGEGQTEASLAPTDAASA
ncbi:hyaluronan synthase [Microbacterium endophyticum]|uniref:Hyaluronan synthase n=1 Tax=Microbacterium endophyticum TaxID=1526412 RepID=A0A7W4V299_9MICO|nr:glycosyltransferase [Microbacterium endophyticum]MBB2975495.1 hyaluronan synthase [Microbacterium endophyticum]NIK35486.1 hyaluronan synthase [Microbacterium endophyticum]